VLPLFLYNRKKQQENLTHSRDCISVSASPWTLDRFNNRVYCRICDINIIIFKKVKWHKSIYLSTLTDVSGSYFPLLFTCWTDLSAKASPADPHLWLPLKCWQADNIRLKENNNVVFFFQPYRALSEKCLLDTSSITFSQTNSFPNAKRVSIQRLCFKWRPELSHCHCVWVLFILIFAAKSCTFRYRL